MRQEMITTVVARFVADRVADLVTFAAVVIAHATNRQLNYQHLGQRMPWLPSPMSPSLLLVSEHSSESIKRLRSCRRGSNRTGNFQVIGSRTTGGW